MCCLQRHHLISYDVPTEVANEDFGSVGRRLMVGWTPHPPDKVLSSTPTSSSTK